MSGGGSRIDAALGQLIESVLESQVYQEYEEQLRRVKGFPELKSQIDEFRTRNYKLQTNENTAIEQIDQFEKEYAEFREDPMVSDFLAAELAFCRMIQDIELRLTEAVHFE